jgi:hypothetical protein
VGEESCKASVRQGKTQKNDVGIFPQENRGSPAGTVGQGEGGEEESSVVCRGLESKAGTSMWVLRATAA